MKSSNKKISPKTCFFSGCSFSRNRLCPKSRESGFTLIEMMIVVAIISILSALAFPSLSTLIPRNRTKAAARELKGYMQKAKLEAIKQNSDCVVVFTPASGTDAGSCLTCISSDSDCTDTDDEIISQLNFNNYSSVSLSSTTFSGDTFIFNARGLPKTLPGHAKIENSVETSYSFKIYVASSGRVRIE